MGKFAICNTVKPRFNGLMWKYNFPFLDNVRYLNTRILPSVDAQYTF